MGPKVGWLVLLVGSLGMAQEAPLKRPLPAPTPLSAEVRAGVWQSRAMLAQIALDFERLQRQIDQLRVKYQQTDEDLKKRLQGLQADSPGWELDENLEWRKRVEAKAGSPERK